MSGSGSEITWGEVEEEKDIGVVQVEGEGEEEAVETETEYAHASPLEGEELKVSEEDADNGAIEPVEKVEVMEITSTMGNDEVVKYDGRGYKLLFDESKEGFKRLPSDFVRRLSSDNRQRYFLAKGAYDFNAEEEGMPDLGDIKVSSRFAKASTRLEVANMLPGWHYVWKRTDELYACLNDGYVIADEEELLTHDSSPSGKHIVAAQGEQEMILMRIPDEVYKAREKENLDEAKRRELGHDRQTQRDISAAGGPGAYYDPARDERAKSKQFSAPVDEKGRPLENTS